MSLRAISSEPTSALRTLTIVPDASDGADGGPQAMIDRELSVLGKQPLDAYVAAVGEHFAQRWGYWVEDERRFLDTPF